MMEACDWDVDLSDTEHRGIVQPENVGRTAPAPVLPVFDESPPVESPPVIYETPAAPMSSFCSAPALRTLKSPIVDALSSFAGQRILYFILGAIAAGSVAAVIKKRSEESEENPDEEIEDEEIEDEEIEDEEIEDEEEEEEEEEEE